MEHLASFVSSRGLLRSCDCHNLNPTSSSTHIDSDLLSRLRPGGTIYVCSDALENFVESFLPSIRYPFYLLTGDSDRSITDACIESPQIKELISSEHLISWHAQNNSSQSDRVKQLPIGLDYHTMWENPGLWGISKTSAIAQEHLLHEISNRAPMLGDRYPVAYCNWTIAGLERGDRLECLEKIDRNVCFFEKSSIPRASTWSRQAECAYVVSPEGFGIDCHRTWEALALGCIPIMKRNNISNLFEDLPVMIVQDWREVRSERLIDFYHQIKDKAFNFSKLFLRYWLDTVRQSSREICPPMRLDEFRNVLLKASG